MAAAEAAAAEASAQRSATALETTAVAEAAVEEAATAEVAAEEAKAQIARARAAVEEQMTAKAAAEFSARLSAKAIPKAASAVPDRVDLEKAMGELPAFGSKGSKAEAEMVAAAAEEFSTRTHASSITMASSGLDPEEEAQAALDAAADAALRVAEMTTRAEAKRARRLSISGFFGRTHAVGADVDTAKQLIDAADAAAQMAQAAALAAQLAKASTSPTRGSEPAFVVSTVPTVTIAAHVVEQVTEGNSEARLRELVDQIISTPIAIAMNLAAYVVQLAAAAIRASAAVITAGSRFGPFVSRVKEAAKMVAFTVAAPLINIAAAALFAGAGVLNALSQPILKMQSARASLFQSAQSAASSEEAQAVAIAAKAAIVTTIPAFITFSILSSLLVNQPAMWRLTLI